MASYSTNEFRTGLRITLDGVPYAIIDNQFIKPGKGQAFNRVKLRNIRTGQVLDKTFKSGDKVQAADVIEIEAQYLYQDGSRWHFMKNDGSFAQLAVDKSAMKNSIIWMEEQAICTLTLLNDEPIAVEPPQTVVLEVAQTDPGLKGDTASGGTKPAVLSTGAKVKVPLFVEQGEKIKVNTRTGEYLARVTK